MGRIKRKRETDITCKKQLAWGRKLNWHKKANKGAHSTTMVDKCDEASIEVGSRVSQDSLDNATGKLGTSQLLLSTQ